MSVLPIPARRGEDTAPYLASLVFFLWPVVVPVYFLRTRGWRALLTGLCFLGLWVVMMAGYGVLLFIR